MYFITPPALARTLHRKNTWWKIPGTAKTLYLTFDDGPVPEVTPLVLEILNAYDVKATFFCVGDNVFKNYPLYQQIVRLGHLTGNHTYDHLNGWNTGNEVYMANIDKCGKLVESTLFRPPYGRIKRSQRQSLTTKFQIIQWSVLSGDFDINLSKERCLNNCLSNLEPGNIFVFHDSLKARKKVEYVLPLFLEASLEKGFSFGLLEPTVLHGNGKVLTS